MTKHKISFVKALQLLNSGELSEKYAISFDVADEVMATTAIKLGALGFDVPDHLITYPTDVEDDDDFAGDWELIDSDVEDHKKHLKISLTIDAEVENWLSDSEVDLDALVSQLITGFYQSAKMLKG